MSRITSQLLDLAKNGVSPEAIKEASAAVQAQQDREARQALQRAFGLLQKELPRIDHNDQIVRGDEVIATFSTYDKILDVIQPSLTKHEFTVTRHTVYAGPNKGDVTVIVTHVDGASIESSFPIIASDWSGMSEAQAIASGETFAARRALCGCLNLVTKGADKNGEAPARQINADVSARPEGYDRAMKMLDTAGKKGGQKAFAKAFKDTPQAIKDWAVANELDKLNKLKAQALAPKGENDAAPF